MFIFYLGVMSGDISMNFGASPCPPPQFWLGNVPGETRRAWVARSDGG